MVLIDELGKGNLVSFAFIHESEVFFLKEKVKFFKNSTCCIFDSEGCPSHVFSHSCIYNPRFSFRILTSHVDICSHTIFDLISCKARKVFGNHLILFTHQTWYCYPVSISPHNPRFFFLFLSFHGPQNWITNLLEATLFIMPMFSTKGAMF